MIIMDTVNEQATFRQDDVFHRADFAKKAMTLIKSHPANRGACVISIDAPWGMGKSTFLRMWMNELNSYGREESKYLTPIFELTPNMCIYYNAWENDYYENAFIPLLFKLCGSLMAEKEEQEEKEKKKRTLLQKVVGAAAGILGYVACASTQQDQGLSAAVGGLAATATESFMQMFGNQDLDSISERYLKGIEVREGFREALSALADEAGKLFFFIDELDRCKPLFAIHTLECIKHYFNTPNVVFVFATDISQLSHSVAGVYGQGIDAGGYLSKFFDYQLHLPAPEISDLLQYAYPKIAVGSGFYDIANEIREAFIITPREMPIILKQAYSLWNALGLYTYSSNISYCFSYLVFVYAIKFKWPELYYKLFHGTLEWHNRIDEKRFMVIYDFFSFTEKWVRKSGKSLQSEIDKINNEIIKRSNNQNVVMTYGDEEMDWLSLLGNICYHQHLGSKTIGEVLHKVFELF